MQYGVPFKFNLPESLFKLRCFEKVFSLVVRFQAIETLLCLYLAGESRVSFSLLLMPGGTHHYRSFQFDKPHPF
jgi:hypothetical protein